MSWSKRWRFWTVFGGVHSSIPWYTDYVAEFISVLNQLDAQNLFHNKFYFMPLHVSKTCTHHQDVKIVSHSLWYHHTYRWPSGAQVERVLSHPVHETATYRCDNTRGCVMQFWPPDDEHICSKHVEVWNKLIVKQKFCASSLLITEINILRCTVSKMSKNH